MTKILVVLGGGGHAREVLGIIQHLRESGDPLQVRGLYAEPGTTSVSARELIRRAGYELSEDISILAGATHFVAAVGDPTVRRSLARVAAANRLAPLALVSAHAVCESTPSPGNVIFPGAFISCNVSLGVHVHVNAGCSVSHDVRIGDWATLSPGVRLTGAAQVGSSALLGTGAIVLPGVRVGDAATVGAGSVVTRDVPAGTTVVGVPARQV